MKIDKEEDKNNEKKQINSACKPDNVDDIFVSNQLQKIVQLLSFDETPQPDSAIDKSIISAAHRNALKSPTNRSYRISWWRKVSLPLYVSAGFVFTVFAYKNLWPEPLGLIQSEDNPVIVQDIFLEIDDSEHSSSANEHQIIASKNRLPKLIKMPTQPNKIASEQYKLQIEPIQPNINLSDETVEPTSQQVFTGNQLVKAKYREKESWAREIIEQMRSGQFEQARRELRDFKSVYPNYPIEEQIKVLLQ